MLKKGIYKTKSGATAVVGQVRPFGSIGWFMRGAVRMENIYYLHGWTIEGQSNHSEPYDLVAG